MLSFIRSITFSSVDKLLVVEIRKLWDFLLKDKTTGQCKRYGFVDFEEAADALRAVEGLNQEGKVRAQMAKVINYYWLRARFFE